MNPNNAKSTTKILVKIWTPLLNRLEARVKTACMKRDQFLDHVLLFEAGQLCKEVETANNNLVKRSISSSFARTETTRVNLYLSVETTELIKSECERLNIPRDSFINRVILFLTASSELIDLLLFDDAEDRWEKFFGYYGEVKGDDREEEDIAFKASPLDIIADVIQHDPFWFLRAVLKKRHELDNTKSPHLYAQVIRDSALQSLQGFPHLSDLEVQDCFFLNCSFQNINFLNQNASTGLDLIDDRLKRLSDEREAEKKKLIKARKAVASAMESNK